MKKINFDYIGVVAENPDGLLEYKRIPIEHSFKELYDELKDMADNENRSVLDLQARLELSSKKNNWQKQFCYCCPYVYSASYLPYDRYPRFMTYDEYKKELESAYNVAQTKKDLKISFLQKVEYYFNVYSYSKMLERLKEVSVNRMFSSEYIGWTTYDYKINNDIEFQVRSNFGYGNSSFFYVNLRYKDIDILPYSDVVTYYHANMCDFIRYTRQYYPERENWNYALDFVVETSNYAIKDESAFIEKWIFNEVEEMMSGLERLAFNPGKEFDNIIKKKLNTFGLISVRNISSYETSKYNIFATEAVVAFQAEKITGALLLMEQIRKLSSVYEKAERVIDRIKEINLELLPKFKKAIPSIEVQIPPLQAEFERLIEKENTLKEKCKPFEDEFKVILKRAEEEAKAKVPVESVSYYSTETEYIKEHPDYKVLLEQIKLIPYEKKTIKDKIDGLNDFINQLTKCIDLVDKFVVAA